MLQGTSISHPRFHQPAVDRPEKKRIPLRVVEMIVRETTAVVQNVRRGLEQDVKRPTVLLRRLEPLSKPMLCSLVSVYGKAVWESSSIVISTPPCPTPPPNPVDGRP